MFAPTDSEAEFGSGGGAALRRRGGNSTKPSGGLTKQIGAA
jgi:hypothetical protein